jgi:hypothetical protein
MTSSPDARMLDVIVLRPVRGGGSGHVGAFFLIDRDCMGLKDAFCRLDVDAVILRENLREMSRTGTAFLKVSLEESRRMVAGAMRWTRAHPFRMPAGVERCLQVLEGAGDVEKADVSEFGTQEGGLLYVGTMADLEQRLVGVTLDDFLDREDVDFISEVGEEEAHSFGFDDEEELEEFEEFEEEEELTQEDHRVFALADMMKTACVSLVKHWCEETGVKPAPMLESAAGIHVAGILAGVAAINDGKTEAQAYEYQQQIIMEFFEGQDIDDMQLEILAALKQILDSAQAKPEELTHAALKQLKQMKPAAEAMVTVQPTQTETTC